MNETSNSTKKPAVNLASIRALILFDGVCGLCNKFVQYVLNHDPKAKFHFASLQSDLAREILSRHGKDPEMLKTVYLIVNPGTPGEKIYAKSNAALRIMGQLEGPARALRVFAFLPLIPDLVYDLVAANRYQLFGKSDSCQLPRAEDRERFLDL